MLINKLEYKKVHFLSFEYKYIKIFGYLNKIIYNKLLIII